MASKTYVLLEPKTTQRYIYDAKMQIRERFKEFRFDKETKRTCLYLTNMMFLILGIGSTVVGVWLYLEKNDYLELTPLNYSALSAAGLCVFTGATVCIISIVGYLAAWMESKCLLVTYLCFVALLALIQGVTGSTSLFYKESSRERVRMDLYYNINRTHIVTRNGHNIQLQITWDHLQHSLQCCGVDSYEDWFYNHQWPENEFVPESCCDVSKFGSVDDMLHCGKTPDITDNWYQRGCYNVFADWLFHHIHVVSTVAVVLIAVEILVFVACFLLLWDLQKGEKDCPNYHYSKGITVDRIARTRSVSEGMP